MAKSNVVRTGFSSLNQTNQKLGLPTEVLPNSTLNQKLGIAESLTPSANDSLITRYVVIGNMGHDFIRGQNGRPKWIAVHHLPRHASLYNMMPFVLRPINDDLSPAERIKYRLRRVEQHRGSSWVAYYGRVLDLTGTKSTLEYRRVQDGVTTSVPHIPTLEDLSPVPPTLVAGEAVLTTGDYLATTAKCPFTMNKQDMEYFQQACEIIEGESGFDIISEIGVVQGIDRTISAEVNGIQQNITEVIYAQITSFISAAWIASQSTDGATAMLDIGNVEPMLVVSPNSNG